MPSLSQTLHPFTVQVFLRSRGVFNAAINSIPSSGHVLVRVRDPCRSQLNHVAPAIDSGACVRTYLVFGIPSLSLVSPVLVLCRYVLTCPGSLIASSNSCMRPWFICSYIPRSRYPNIASALAILTVHVFVYSNPGCHFLWQLLYSFVRPLTYSHVFGRPSLPLATWASIHVFA